AALAAAGCALTLARAAPAAGSATGSTVDKSRLVHPAGLRPGAAYGASVWGYTAFNTYIPLHVAGLGGPDARTVYVVYGVVLLGVRVAGHRLIERLPARRVGGVSLGCTAAGLLVLLWPPTLVGGTALLAVGQALGLPAFITAAIDAVPAGQRGSALATVTAFFDVGFLTSALGLGAVTQLLGLGAGFTVAAAVSAAALLVFVRTPTVRTDPSLRSDP
ncbi:MAG: MFS transporter, partial [Actinophytocola sp.]|uniref:MFS transporter n=1 Tax=Actinophytocola sp. TaxID=1872138 RepID=UPI00132B5840